MTISEGQTGPAEHVLLELFHQNIDRILDDLKTQQDLDVVVGIPFHAERDTLGDVIETARAGIKNLGLAGKAVVLCAGPERSRPVFDAVAAKIKNASAGPSGDQNGVYGHVSGAGCDYGPAGHVQPSNN